MDYMQFHYPETTTAGILFCALLDADIGTYTCTYVCACKLVRVCTHTLVQTHMHVHTWKYITTYFQNAVSSVAWVLK